MTTPAPFEGSDQGIQAVRQLADTVDAATPAVDVLGRTSDALLGAVPADIWCAVLLDPSTLLDTGGVHTSGFSEDLMPRLFEIEHAQQLGVDNLRQLARRRGAVSVLSRSTHGELDSSVYFQDVLRPAGMADEMRVLLREGTRTWDLLCWCRAGTTGFTDADVAAATALAAPATSALRGSLLLAGKDTGELSDAPGMLIIEDGELVSATPSARRWLEDLQEDHRPTRDNTQLPYAVRAVIAGAASAQQTHPAFARAQCRSGRWVGVRAWATEASRTVVGIGPADFGELVAIILDAYGLTPRERDVAQHVLRGASTGQIAVALELSSYTVQDHLKKVFDKTGVTSRRDLVAAIFFQHYFPALGHGPLTTDGRLLQPPATE